ncbi:MAG TPA: proline--tRNA ligase [Candidatus Polarisedimenticolia bacterium]|nr:proline--tRNA ligase [Candidatus Polarisedimenticolia bacterium]
MSKVITPRAEDYSRWYTDVVLQSQMADYSPVKGCMVIRPLGYAVWEAMQRELDARFRATGHQNAYFPLLIPESFMKREAEHVEGFAPECAVVTHGGGKKLEEPLIIRPTSETIIYEMYSKWIRSYRDLPLLINQWANIVRWEMRTRLFLRTTEFLWQEGHTAHATEAEAEEEVLKILEIYRSFAEDCMAVPVYTGRKTNSEKFAGALRTYCIEALMQDGKALQAGTSHSLGQNFAKAFDVKFQTTAGDWQHVWNTSWGVSTRLVGAVVMSHGDDNGVAFPPRLAPTQVVIVPIWKSDEQKARIGEAARKAEAELAATVRVKADLREEISPGWKYNEWELKGVPLRLEIGPRDLDASQFTAVRRMDRKKTPVPFADLPRTVTSMLEEIQKDMTEVRRKDLVSRTYVATDYQAFQKDLDEKAGFYRAGWCGDGGCEAKIKEETKATIRCIPLTGNKEEGQCLRCNVPSHEWVLFARAY